MMKWKFMGLGLALVTLSACNEYTQEICTPELRADIQGLDGDFEWQYSMGDNGGAEKEFRIQSIKGTLHRLEKGRYTSTSDSQVLKAFENLPVSTCIIGNKTLIEGYNPETKTYASQVLDIHGNKVDSTFLAFDKGELDNSAIPYHIEERKDQPAGMKVAQRLFLRQGEKEDVTRVLVVENDKMQNPSLVANYLHDLFFTFTVKKITAQK